MEAYGISKVKFAGTKRGGIFISPINTSNLSNVFEVERTNYNVFSTKDFHGMDLDYVDQG